MKKILPIQRDNLIITECWNHYKLSVILTRQNNIPWYIENFINVNVYDGFLAFYNEVDSVEWASPAYDSLLRYEKIDENNFLDSLIKGIDNGGYPIIYISFNDIHHHEILLYGYDTEEKTFDCVVPKKDPDFFQEKKLSFEKVVDIHKKGLKILFELPQKVINFSSLHYPASIMYLRDTEERDIEIVRILRTFKLMLCSTTRGVSKVLMYPEEDELRWSRMYRGAGVYKVYHKILYDALKKDPKIIKEHKPILLGLKKLLESKEKLIYRLKYIYDKKYIMNVDLIVNQINQLITKIRQALGVLEKFSVVANENLLEKMKNYMIQCEIIECSILAQLIDVFEKAVLSQIEKV